MKQHPIIGIAALGIINGLFSPLLAFALVLHALWLPAWLPVGPGVTFMLSSLMVSTTTIMAAGVPAALYERVAGKTETTEISALIWIGVLALLTVPALLAMIAGAG